MEIYIEKEKFCSLCGEEMLPDDEFHLDGKCMEEKNATPKVL